MQQKEKKREKKSKPTKPTSGMVLTKDGVPEREFSRSNGETCNIRCKDIECSFTVLTLSVARFLLFGIGIGSEHF